MKFSSLAFCGVLLVSGVLGGCATTGENSKLSLEQLMGDSDSAAASGLSDKSLDLLNRAAREFPTRKEPWLRMAQMHFEGHDYGQAILAAEEVLERDDKDQLAKSILAVSGLRVSAAALAKLREDQVITGDVRLEAKMLARTLRDTLGEADLFNLGKAPGDAKSGEQVRKVPPLKRAAKPPVPVAASSAPAAKAAGGTEATQKTGGGDPFGALK